MAKERLDYYKVNIRTSIIHKLANIPNNVEEKIREKENQNQKAHAPIEAAHMVICSVHYNPDERKTSACCQVAQNG